MANPIIEQLRHSIDAKHAEAIRAMETLAAYFEEPSPQNNGSQIETKRRSPRKGTGNIRNAVLAALGKAYLSVEVAAKETGLEPQQVRGVLSAPSLIESFVKKEIDGVMHYKYEGEVKQ